MQEHRQINETLIAYFARELSLTDRQLIEEWVMESEVNRRHFFALRDTWQLLAANQFVDNIDVEIEWKQFRKSIDLQETKEAMDTAKEITLNENKQVRVSLRTMLIRVAVAASLIAGVAVGWISLTRKHEKRSDQLAVVAKGDDSIAVLFQREVNNSGQPRRFQLDDGTSVKLENGSELTYRKGFAADKRELRLTGKAHFDVVKDSQRPFTVISGAIRTTALGTSFSVDAFIASPQMIVQLFEGKVLVSFYPSGRNKAENYYLKPGDELIFNKALVTAKVKRMAAKERSTTALVSNEDEPKVANHGDDSWFMFNNQPLSEVLDQLENMFKVDIVYSKKEVSRLYVIGSFRTTDSVQNIIKQIARLNQLKVTSTNGKIFISR